MIKIRKGDKRGWLACSCREAVHRVATRLRVSLVQSILIGSMIRIRAVLLTMIIYFRQWYLYQIQT